MNKLELKRAKLRVAALQRQMGKLGPFMRGTVVVIGDLSATVRDSVGSCLID